MDGGSIDGVFFNKSLHHVPVNLMDAALIEAVRVLKPETGFLFVHEPLLTGTLSPLCKPFHDETEVRTLAYEALKRTAKPRFEQARELIYSSIVRYANFDAFLEQWTGKSFNDIQADQVDTPEVRALFEAGRTDDGYAFTAPQRVNLYRGSSFSG